MHFDFLVFTFFVRRFCSISFWALRDQFVDWCKEKDEEEAKK